MVMFHCFLYAYQRDIAEAPLKSKALRLLFNEQLSFPPGTPGAPGTSRDASAKTRPGRPTWSATLEVKMRWKGPDALDVEGWRSYSHDGMTDPWCWYINANMTGGILMGSMLPYIAYMDPMGLGLMVVHVHQTVFEGLNGMVAHGLTMFWRPQRALCGSKVQVVGHANAWLQLRAG